MHTLHWWAVEAEDKHEAFITVQDRLIMEDGRNWVDWSDWHVVGGGRWSNSQYEDSEDMIISYNEQPELFKERLELIKKNRIEEMNNFLTKIDLDQFTSDMVDYISNSGIPVDKQRFELNSYYIQKAGQLLQDYYTCDSYFYDFVEYTAHMGYIYDRLDNPEHSLGQYLVPIDFHF
jgi:hypothetical protein